jgi:hypothetical protein
MTRLLVALLVGVMLSGCEAKPEKGLRGIGEWPRDDLHWSGELISCLAGDSTMGDKLTEIEPAPRTETTDGQ